MKTKFKNSLKIIVFFLLLALLISLVQWSTVNHAYTSHLNIRGFYEQKENSLDAVYIGSSNCFTYWNPIVAWDKYGIATYSYSADNLLFESTEFIIKDCVKTQPQAKFIVNINTLYPGELDTTHIHNSATNMPISSNKYDLINHISDIAGLSLLERMEYYFPIIRFHDNFSALQPKYLFAKPDGFKGASTYYPYTRIATDISDVYLTSDGIGELPEYLVKSTESLLDYCDANKIDVVFVTVPQARGEKKIMTFNALNKLISDRGYRVVDLMEKTSEMGIDISKDFYNIQHTNIHGSIKFTHYISRYLIDTFGFENKKDNENYAEWNVSADKYYKKISPFILDIEKDINYRDFTISIPENLNLSENVLSWESADGAEYYYVYKKADRTSPWQKIEEKIYDLSYTDKEFVENNVYTVVPVVVKDGEEYFGNFDHHGVPVYERDIGVVEPNPELSVQQKTVEQ